MIEWGRSVDRVRKTGFPDGDFWPAWAHFGGSGVIPKGANYSEPIEFTAGHKELHFVLNKTQQEFNQLSRKLKGQ